MVTARSERASARSASAYPYEWRAKLPVFGPGPYAVVDNRIVTDGIEVVVTHHCNLRCRGCAYLAPVQSKALVDPAQLRRDLAALARAYHASEARVLGGEPLLHPDIISVLEAIRGSGVSDSIRVITNGVQLTRVPEGFWEAVDEISVSVYPGRGLRDDLVAQIETEAAAHNVALRFKHFDYFRESYSEIGTDDESLVRRIYQTCQMANTWRCHTVWHGRLYRCPQSLFLPLALDETVDSSEGIEIDETVDFLPRLLAFLEDSRPLSSCRNCLGSVGRLFTNSQVRRSGWREPQRTPTEYLVDREHLLALEKNPRMIVKDTSYLTGNEVALER